MLYYRHEKIHMPAVTLDKSTIEDDCYHGCVSFIPDLNPASTEECWKAIYSKDNFLVGSKMPSKRMEFLFLIDCSNSMLKNNSFK